MVDYSDLMNSVFNNSKIINTYNNFNPESKGYGAKFNDKPTRDQFLVNMSNQVQKNLQLTEKIAQKLDKMV